jgi:hypothetical protein
MTGAAYLSYRMWRTYLSKASIHPADKVNRGSLPIFHPEFGRFMLEATPGQPWGIGFKDLLDVEKDMKLR